jgi:hypothetical protein
MKSLRGFDFGETLLLIWLGLWLAGAVGWCMNLYKLITICCEPTAWLLTRAIGVVLLPLGAIVGFL